MKVTDPEAIKASPKEGSVKPKESMTVKIKYHSPKKQKDSSKLKVMVEAVIAKFEGLDILPYFA
ncbi:hypothetical protein BaRGS_00034671, partial [Batillaria attramentaria]